MKKRFLSLLLVALFVFGINNSIGIADSNFNNIDSTALEYEVLRINHNGNEKELFIQFKDRENALRYVKIKYSEIFDFVEKDCGFQPVSMYNWEEYSQEVNILDQMNTEFSNKYFYELAELNKFFDVFENTDTNITIMELVNDESRSNDNEELIELLLPYKRENSKEEMETRETVDINLDL